MQKLGVVPQQIAPSDIYPALERGVIDGAGYIGPYDDEKLGFARVAKFYYYPGFQDSRPPPIPGERARLGRAAGGVQEHAGMRRRGGLARHGGEYDVLNPPALRRLVASGAQLRPYPREVIAALYGARRSSTPSRRAEPALPAHPRALGQVPPGTEPVVPCGQGFGRELRGDGDGGAVRAHGNRGEVARAGAARPPDHAWSRPSNGITRFLPSAPAMAKGTALPRTLQHPARLVPLTFLLAIVAGTALLMLPIARAGEGGAPLLTALFTATSAVCVTGLAIVDTPTYWSGFGQAVILALFQIGGFGIMTGATLLGLLVARRLRLSTRLVAQAETRSLGLGDVAGVLRLVLSVTVGVELATAAVLTLRLHHAYGEPWGEAAWSGLFLAVSAFNNAGFSTYSDNMVGFARRPAGPRADHGRRDPGRHRLPGPPRHAPEPAAGRRGGRCTPRSRCSAPRCSCSAGRRWSWPTSGATRRRSARSTRPASCSAPPSTPP